MLAKINGMIFFIYFTNNFCEQLVLIKHINYWRKINLYKKKAIPVKYEIC